MIQLYTLMCVQFYTIHMGVCTVLCVCVQFCVCVCTVLHMGVCSHLLEHVVCQVVEKDRNDVIYKISLLMMNHQYTNVIGPFYEGNMIVAGLPKQVNLGMCERDRKYDQ